VIRLLFYIIIFFAIVYFILWLKSRFNRLKPELKKKILYFGMFKIIQIFKAKWYLIVTILWQVLKQIIKK
jgi:hypothetical protein